MLTAPLSVAPQGSQAAPATSMSTWKRFLQESLHTSTQVCTHVQRAGTEGRPRASPRKSVAVTLSQHEVVKSVGAAGTSVQRCLTLEQHGTEGTLLSVQQH